MQATAEEDRDTVETAKRILRAVREEQDPAGPVVRAILKLHSLLHRDHRNGGGHGW